jgi:hypothetical protein
MKPPSKEERAALRALPPTLTADEIRLLTVYRATAIARRSETADFANMVSKMYPLVVEARPPAPVAIRLVTDDGKKVP